MCDVAVGAAVVVRSVAPGEAGQGRRLEDLGVIAGTIVRVERRAPMGDPTIYEVRNKLAHFQEISEDDFSEVFIIMKSIARKADAALVQVEAWLDVPTAEAGGGGHVAL